MLSWRQRPAAAANSRRARPRTERPDTRAPEPPPPPPPAAVSPPGAPKTMYYMHGGVVYAPAPQRIALTTWQIPNYTPPPPPPALPPPARPAGPCHAFSSIPTQAQLIGMQDDLVAVTRHAFAQHALHADNAPGDVFRRVANDVLAWIAAAVRRVHPDVRTRVLLRLMGVAYVHIDMVAGREVDGPAVRAALLDAQITSDLDFGCGHEPAWAPPPPPQPPPPVVSADTAAVLLPQRLHSSYAAAAAAATASTRRPATTASPAEQFALGTGTWPIGPPPPPPPLVALTDATTL